jgi:3-oxoacyl-[acyl-carrier-protein] synthase III
LRNVQEHGNTAAAGVPTVVAQNLPRLKTGDRIIYAVVGSGLAWGAGLLEVL